MSWLCFCLACSILDCRSNRFQDGDDAVQMKLGLGEPFEESIRAFLAP